MRQRFDFFFAQRIGDIRHCSLGSAGADAGLVVVQRLHEIFLALAGEARYRLGAGVAVGVTDAQPRPAAACLPFSDRSGSLSVGPLGGVSDAK